MARPQHSGHKGYWHAAESVLAARQLAGAATQPADATTLISRSGNWLLQDPARHL
jgi:hypothetical protein